MIERPNFVRVVNTGKAKVVGRFSGQDYEFLPNKPNDIDVMAARHIFGFGEENKVSALNRLGWLTSSDGLEKALARLQAIVFTEAPPLVEADMMEDEDPSVANRLPGTTTAPPVSPETSGAGGGGRALPPPPKPPR